jgi:hypothetical protein
MNTGSKDNPAARKIAAMNRRHQGLRISEVFVELLHPISQPMGGRKRQAERFRLPLLAVTIKHVLRPWNDFARPPEAEFYAARYNQKAGTGRAQRTAGMAVLPIMLDIAEVI